MTTHTSITAGVSQCDAILSRLERAKGAWVAMPKLVECSGAYAVHSRISDLRKRGHVIEHTNRRTPGNPSVHSFYRLP